MAWALASEGEGKNAERQERQERKYQQEQARIDLDLLKFKSTAAAGIISWEEAQAGTDQWVKDNHSRLRKQAALAAELDHLTPLPSEPNPASRAGSPLPDGSPEAVRFRKLEQEEELAMAKIPRQTSPEDRQGLMDAWVHSKEGAKILQEKQQLLAAAHQRSAAGPPLSPPPPAAGASPAKLAQAMVASRRHALLVDLHTRFPNASPEARQSLIAQENAKFEALNHESAALQIQIIQEDLATETAFLTTIAADPAPTPPSTPTPRRQ